MSHRSSHQAMVTRSPNHMCASSCAVTSIISRRWATLGPGGIDEEDLLGEGDRPRVLHRARPVLGHGEEVELLERIGPAEVALEGGRGAAASPAPPPRPARRFPLTVTMRPGTDMPVIGTVSNGPDGEREQVRGQRRRRLEDDGPGRAARRLALHGRVGDGEAGRGDGQGELVRDLERGLVPAGEGPARVGGLELGERVPVGAGLRAIEADGSAYRTAP